MFFWPGNPICQGKFPTLADKQPNMKPLQVVRPDCLAANVNVTKQKFIWRLALINEYFDIV